MKKVIFMSIDFCITVAIGVFLSIIAVILLTADDEKEGDDYENDRRI